MEFPDVMIHSQCAGGEKNTAAERLGERVEMRSMLACGACWRGERLK